MGTAYKDGFDVKEHLGFEEIRDTGKTKVWRIANELHGVDVGEIKWNGAWRKYCLFPYEGTVFDTKCLGRISEFINEQMELRKKRKS